MEVVHLIEHKKITLEHLSVILKISFIRQEMNYKDFRDGITLTNKLVYQHKYLFQETTKDRSNDESKEPIQGSFTLYDRLWEKYYLLIRKNRL